MSDACLHSRIGSFFHQQLKQWPEVAQRYSALEATHHRELQLQGPQPFRVALQYNPARIRSTVAEVDAQNIAKRSCFLCQENQPKEQQSILWQNDFRIQVNPFPIFKQHFTVALNRHQPQMVQGRGEQMLALAYELPGYELFYNGPKCGASAPDHLHFQIASAGEMPLFEELDILQPDKVFLQSQTEVGLFNSIGRPIFVLRSTIATEVANVFEYLLRALPSPPDSLEPMVNVLWRYQPGCDQYTILVVPRAKHRPSCYGSAPGQVLVSPASVDMAGLITLPRECDYQLLSEDQILAIFADVCASRELVDAVFTDLKQNN